MEYGNYTRTVSSARTLVGDAILNYYSRNASEYTAFIFPSGMSAIYTVVSALADAKERILCGDELYCDTPKLFQYMEQQKLVSGIDKPDLYSTREQYKIAFFESCSNPHGNIPDYKWLRSIKERSGNHIVVVIDNTWLSAASFNPFEHGADIVIESLSKYASQGSVIAGCAVMEKKYSDAVFGMIRRQGLHVTTGVCETIKESLESVHKRIAKSSANTRLVIDSVLEEYLDPRGIIVYPEHIPGAKILPSIFLMRISLPNSTFPSSSQKKLSENREILKQITLQHGVHYETSFGSAYHKIDSYAYMVKHSGKVYFEVRVYVGFDEPLDCLIKLLHEIAR